MFNKVLVANRGEIALRIVRACRDLGIRSVAVYSEVDRLSPHVRYADEAHLIGPADARQSYLNIDRILQVAKDCGAEAIHPGYGFLAENSLFAEAVNAAGLTFIGPTPQSMRTLGDKLQARALAESIGVPVVPGSTEVQTIDDATQIANDVGYPVMIKAAAGGGGRGIRLARSEGEVRRLAAQSIQEAQAAFGNPTIYIERNLSPVRHIEVQVIADHHGNVVHLGERECSIQRRHQKLIEECPSVALDKDLRRAITRAATKIARAADYHNVGTVEFLLTEDRQFFFLEMNTRLQVEHPVTEITTGVDLVKDAILVAAGEPLAYDETELLTRGWAIECRIVAEDPFNNFLPSVGRVVFAREPAGPGIRVESALFDGMEITPYYDSLLAKVTAWGRTRDGALERMRRALTEMRVVGVATNIPYLLQVLQRPEFREGKFDTEFLDRHGVEVAEPLAQQEEAAAIAALLLVTGDANGTPEQVETAAPAGNGKLMPAPSAWKERMTRDALRTGMGRWPKSI